MEEELKYTEVEIDEINIKELIYRYLKNWKWFLLSIIVCVGLGYTYLSYQVPQYEASAKILIKDEKNGGSIIDESSVFEDLGLLKGGKNIDNEIEVLKSRSLMISAVKSLHANIFYYSYGRPIYHEKFKDTPIEVNCLNSDTNNCNQGMGNWIIYPLNNSKFQLSNAGTKAILGEFYFGQTIQTPLGKLRFNITKYFNKGVLNKPFKVNILPQKHIVDRYFEALAPLDIENDKEGLNYFIPNHKGFDFTCLPEKFKDGFIKWLWKAREKIAMRNYHPSKFQELFDRGFDINEIDVDNFDSYFT
jgi:hypothetical protein